MRRRPGLGLLLGLTLATACDEEQPIPSGDLRRPGDLVFVERDPFTTDGSTVALRRADVLVADAEAQGVRIVQYAERVASDGDVGREPVFFVPAPVPFFKLAASAPGFPTRVAVSARDDRDDAARPRLAYVIAPAASALHVLEVDPTPYRWPLPRSTDEPDPPRETNVQVGSIDLTALGAGLEGRIPVDVAFLGRAGASPVEDWVAVAFDGLGERSGRVLLLSITQNPSATSLEDAHLALVRDTAVMPSGVRDLAWAEAERRLLVATLGASTSAHVVELTVALPQGADGAPSFAGRRAIDAGGPVRSIVLAEGLGALAVRTDTPALAWLPFGDQGFDRAQVDLPGPFDATAPAEVVAQPGVLVTRDSPVVAADAGRLEELVVPGGLTIFEAEAGSSRDVLLLAHADGRVSLIHQGGADDDRPVIAANRDETSLQYVSPGDNLGESADSRTSRASPLDFSLPDCTTRIDDEEVAQEIPLACTDREDEDEPPFCAFDGLERRFFDAVVPSLRITPRGRLYQSTRRLPARDLTLTVTRGPGGEARTASVSATFVDEVRTDLDGFLVREGDAVRVDLVVPDCGDEAAPGADRLELGLTGRLVSVMTDPDISSRRALIQVALSVPDATTAATLEACAEALEAVEAARSLVIHVPDDVDEAVLAGVGGEQVIAVYERAPMEMRDDGVVAATFGDALGSLSPLNLEVEMRPSDREDGRIEEALRCTLRSAETDDELGRCLSASDCSQGRVCSAPVVRCSGRCSASCSGADCFESKVVRVCPSLRIELNARGPVAFDLRAVGALNPNRAFSATAPGDVLYHPQRESFLISYPGSGTLLEFPVSGAGRSIGFTN